MRTRTRLAALAAMLLLPAAGAAQKLEPGKWTGTVTPPDGGMVNVTYDVKVLGDSLAITVDAGEHGAFPFQGIKLAEGKLTFTIVPGPVVNCTLSLKDTGSWAGDCVDPDGGVAQMVMIAAQEGIAASRSGQDDAVFRK